MGFFRQYRAVAMTWGKLVRRLFQPALALCIVGFFILVATTSSPGQLNSAVGTSTPTSSDVIPAYLDKCKCGDAQRLKDRLEKLKGAALLVANRLQSTPATKPAGGPEWNALQSQINGYLRAMQIQGLTTFPDDSLFLGNNDPFCRPQTVDAGECLNQDFAVHQTGHDASCRNGKWAWQTSWIEKDMLLEEGNTIEKEMKVIDETIKRLGCGLAGSNPPPVQPTQPIGGCPQFGIIVQNVTTTSANIPGALTEQSGRSLNNGQGIAIPLTFHEDGSFEGFGSGSDAGSGMGASPGETVGGRFGHSQSIAASGFIRPAGCNTQGCQDVMHLVLAGGPASQMRDMHARGVINRDINQPTPTNAATMEFDLPAYVGGSARKTFFATPILNSYMTVNLVQGNNGTSALPVGSSLLYSLQQCKLGGPPAGGDGGGAAGVVIPGLENIPPAPTKKLDLAVPNPGVVGVVIPGLEGIASPSSGVQSSTSASGKNRNGDVIPVLPPKTITVNESVSVSDSPSTIPSVSIAVNETVHVNDSGVPIASAVVGVTETVRTTDTANPALTPALKLQVPRH
jgi:hypothetical protein